jgi:hypothetical protein
VSEWSNMSIHGLFISWQEQVNVQWDDDEVHFVLDQHAELDFHNASSLKQQSAGRHVASTLTLFVTNSFHSFHCRSTASVA